MTLWQHNKDNINIVYQPSLLLSLYKFNSHGGVVIQIAFMTLCGQTLFYSEGKGVGHNLTIEQFVTPHHGVCTNHSTVFSHMIPEVHDLTGNKMLV